MAGAPLLPEQPLGWMLRNTTVKCPEDAETMFLDLMERPHEVGEFYRTELPVFKLKMERLKHLLPSRLKSSFKTVMSSISSLAEAHADIGLGDESGTLLTTTLESLPPDDLLPREIALQLRAPPGFVIKDAGVFKIVANESGDATEKPVCASPLLITGNAVDVITNAHQVTLVYKSGHRWLRHTVPVGMLATPKHIEALSNIGVRITSANIRTMIVYLDRYRTINQGVLPEQRVVDHLGWVQGKYFTLPGGTIYPDCADDPNIYFQPRMGNEWLREAVSTAGTREDAIATFQMIQRYPQALAALYHSLASILVVPLTHLGLEPWAMDIGGLTGTGKTVAAEIQAWVWGPPIKYMRSWSDTNNKLQVAAHAFGSLPLVINELKMRQDKKGIADAVKFLFNFQEGKGRGGLTSTRSELPQDSWCSTMTTTSETMLIQLAKGNAGARARAVPMHKPFFGAFDIKTRAFLEEELKPALHSSHGHLGEMFAEVIVGAMAYEELREHIFTRYKELSREHVSLWGTSTTASRVCRYTAATQLAGELLHTFLPDDFPMPTSFYQMVPVFGASLEIISEYAVSASRQLFMLAQFLQANPRHVIGMDATSGSQLWAAWPVKGTANANYLIINSFCVEAFLASSEVDVGVDGKTMIAMWGDADYIRAPDEEDSPEAFRKCTESGMWWEHGMFNCAQRVRSSARDGEFTRQMFSGWWIKWELLRPMLDAGALVAPTHV